ncbi:MAG TPA: nucleoside triphosphate pyrophosphatase [Candidatus Kapabacteria bacterium]|nr:nucleoside triphosphate pyrophosphatase [Candidatus Kapabacteria bacterium]
MQNIQKQNQSLADLLNIPKDIVLASSSPRRKKLLETLGISFHIMHPKIDENNFKTTNPIDIVQELAHRKAKEIALQIKNALVIGADTIVVCDGKLFNKPSDKQEAFNYLKYLSNRTHTVYTGIALYDSDTNESLVANEQTQVSFRELDDDEIWAYIGTGSPLDKAGAYGIQDDFGAVFVNKIVGDFYNIVGLPLTLLYLKLKEFSKNYTKI